MLVDAAKALKPRHVQLEFDDGARRWPVRFERTDRDETVGVLGGGAGGADASPGFTLAPGGTRTVGLRLAFNSDAVPGGVVASAAVVRRRDDDGDWVGASNDYAFDIARRVFGMSVASASGIRGKFRAFKAIAQMPRFSPLGLMNRNKGVFGLNLGHMWREGEKVRDWTQEIMRGVAEGWIRPHVDRAFPFDQIAEAHRHMEERKNTGKVVLVP